MLDIYTCIISCIVFSNLVLNLYFRDTNTWNSCDVHYLEYMIFVDPPCYFILWSRVLEILLLYYTTVTRLGHLMFIIFMWQHACTVLLYMIYHLDYSCYCYYFQFSILPKYYAYVLLIITTSSCSLFYHSFPSCTLAGPLLTDLYYII